MMQRGNESYSTHGSTWTSVETDELGDRRGHQKPQAHAVKSDIMSGVAFSDVLYPVAKNLP